MMTNSPRYPPKDPGAKDEPAMSGKLTLPFGTIWTKGISVVGGQCPVMQHNRNLLKAILAGKLRVARVKIFFT
jgi:glutathione-independent formaldehyde dehydrogenase